MAPDLSMNPTLHAISEGVYRERTLLQTISASDPDSGDNGTVRFRLEQCGKTLNTWTSAFAPRAASPLRQPSSGASHASQQQQQQLSVLTIDERSGELWLEPGELDREALPDPGAGICVRVRATDMGHPTARSSTLELVFEVLDINDHIPRLDSNRTLLCGAGCSGPGLMLRAADPDRGPNGTVLFSLVHPSPLFSLDPHTGTLTLTAARPLSLPHQSPSLSSSGVSSGSGPGTSKDQIVGAHELLVNLSDCGSPPRSALERITVHVTADALALTAAGGEETSFARTFLVVLVLLVLLLFTTVLAVSFAVCRILQRSHYRRPGIRL